MAFGMLLIDLFCGAGGAAMGYHRAGFKVIGVDLHPQPRYPFEFIQGDVREVWDSLPHDDVFMYHASPPCQIHSVMTNGRWQDRIEDHIDLVGYTRGLLKSTGKPYVIENVIGAPLENPLMLCGTMFGLASDYGNQLRRHRLFETNPNIWFPPAPCNHNALSAIGVYGGGQHPERRRGGGGFSEFGIEQRRGAMGIDWMTGKELNQAIPPAYTEWIASQFISARLF